MINPIPKIKIDRYLKNNYLSLLNSTVNVVYVASVPENIENPDPDKYYLEMGVWDFKKEITLTEYLDTEKSKKSQTETKTFDINVENINLPKLQIDNITESKIRPAAAGCALSYEGGYFGTIGAVIKIAIENEEYRQLIADENWYIISNYHVLSPPKFKKGLLIFQPSIYYKSDIEYGNVIARLEYGEFNNYVDVALAKVINKSQITGGNIWDNRIPVYKENSPIEIGEEVMIYGKTSHRKYGLIKSDHAYVRLYNPITKKWEKFYDQILTTNLSDNGDSGSILITKNNQSIGLLIGGDKKTYSVHNKLDTIFGKTLFGYPKKNSKIYLKEFVKLNS